MLATRQTWFKPKENDNGRSQDSPPRLQLQIRWLPLQSLHLQELQLLTAQPEHSWGRVGDGAARFRGKGVSDG